MYCSDYEYDSDSEQPMWEEASNDEFDMYDGEAANLDYESRTVIPEEALNPWLKMWVHAPVQLAALTSKYETLGEAREARRQQLMEQEEEDRRTRMQMFEDELVQNEIDLVAHYKFMSTLPTESVDGKIKRMAREKTEAEERTKARIKKAKAGNKPLPFGHRRNGGGKHSHHEPATKEVVAARRALHRAQTKKANKREEAVRTEKFKVEGPTKVVEVEYIPLAKSKLVQCEEELEELAHARAKTVEMRSEEYMMEPKKTKTTVTKTVTVTTSDWQTVSHRGKTIEPLVIKMGAAPYRPSWERPTLPTKGPMVPQPQEQLTRTRMCSSVTTGRKCPHGVKCRFAHTTDELQVGQCMFGRECRFVSCKGADYFNLGGDKLCQYIHPEEIKDSYLHRVGIKRVETTPKKTEPKKTEPKKITPAPPPTKAVWNKARLELPRIQRQDSHPPAEVVMAPLPAEVKVWNKVMVNKIAPPPAKVESPTQPSAPAGKRVCRSVTTGVVCPHGAKCRFSHVFPPPPRVVKMVESPKETVLVVPAAMAIQALEMALARGLVNVRVEVI